MAVEIKWPHMFWFDIGRAGEPGKKAIAELAYQYSEELQSPKGREIYEEIRYQLIQRLTKGELVDEFERVAGLYLAKRQMLK